MNMELSKMAALLVISLKAEFGGILLHQFLELAQRDYSRSAT